MVYVACGKLCADTPCIRLKTRIRLINKVRIVSGPGDRGPRKIYSLLSANEFVDSHGVFMYTQI